MNAALRVLVIDDEERVRTALQSELEEASVSVGDGSQWEVRGQGFDGVNATLVSFRPDMVVLDLVEGEIPNERDSGNRSFEQIWDTWYCPIVVYTSFADRRTFREHGQVIQVIKGRDSDAQVLAELRNFEPVARMIRSVHEDFDARIREALRDSVDALGNQIAGAAAQPRDAALSRAVRRHVAARVDLAASAGTKLRAWERFVVPPLGDDLLTADVLRRRHADPTDPRAFCLVLTPSCDMVASGNRSSNVDRVLVAWCEWPSQLGKIELKPGEGLTGKQRKSLRSILTEGMAGEHLAIPSFVGHVPLMAANLKSLELIDRDRIDPRWNGSDKNGSDKDADGPELVRAASTDSPFREMVVWAYLRVTGRPGMPEIDIDRWLDDISDHLEASGSP